MTHPGKFPVEAHIHGCLNCERTRRSQLPRTHYTANYNMTWNIVSLHRQPYQKTVILTLYAIICLAKWIIRLTARTINGIGAKPIGTDTRQKPSLVSVIASHHQRVTFERHPAVGKSWCVSTACSCKRINSDVYWWRISAPASCWQEQIFQHLGQLQKN